MISAILFTNIYINQPIKLTEPVKFTLQLHAVPVGTQWRSEGAGGGPGPRAQALEGAPAQLQRRSQVSLAGGGGADRIPGGGDKPQYLWGPRGVFRDLRPGAILRATARPRQFKKTTCDLCCFKFLMKKSDLVTWGLEKQRPGDLRGGPLLGLTYSYHSIWLKPKNVKVAFFQGAEPPSPPPRGYGSAQLVGANFKKKIRPRQISKVTSLQCAGLT